MNLQIQGTVSLSLLLPALCLLRITGVSALPRGKWVPVARETKRRAGIPGDHSHHEAIEGREQRNASTQNYPSVQRHDEKEIEGERTITSQNTCL